MRLRSLADEVVREAEEIDRIHRTVSSVMVLVAARRFKAYVELFLEHLSARSTTR